jgi:hypothetical protein
MISTKEDDNIKIDTPHIDSRNVGRVNLQSFLIWKVNAFLNATNFNSANTVGRSPAELSLGGAQKVRRALSAAGRVRNAKKRIIETCDCICKEAGIGSKQLWQCSIQSH